MTASNLEETAEALVQKIDRTEKNGWIKMPFRNNPKKIVKVRIEKRDEKLVIEDLNGLSDEEKREFMQYLVKFLYEATCFLVIEIVGHIAAIASIAAIDYALTGQVYSSSEIIRQMSWRYSPHWHYGPYWTCFNRMCF